MAERRKPPFYRRRPKFGTKMFLAMREALRDVAGGGATSGEPSPNTSNFSLASNSTASSSSPANKRRTSFRKWLTNPVRKLSQSRLDKQSLEKSMVEGNKSQKAGDKKKFFKRTKEEPPLAQQEDLPEEDGGERGSEAKSKEQVETPSETGTPEIRPSTPPGVNGEDEENDPIVVEMPPPMKVIVNPIQPTGGSHENVSTLSLKPDPNVTSSDLKTAIENFVKNRNTTPDSPTAPAPAEGGGAETEDAESASEQPEEEEAMSEEKRISKKYLSKRQFAIEELISTEKDYVRDLGWIVEDYIPKMREGPLPEGMESGQDRIVLGNIEHIFEWHRDKFLEELGKCSKEPERLGTIFIRFEKRLDAIYVRYCQNKPKSEYIVAEHIEYFERLRNDFGHRLTLPDLLIKPVQRIMRYQLLLNEILKYTEKAGEDTKDLLRAVEVMKIVPKAANDMMNMGRLQGFPLNISCNWKLLLHDTLTVMEVSPKVKPADQKFRERKVFLFDQIVIISEEMVNKKNNLCGSSYVFKHHLMVNRMGFHEKGNGEPMTFTLNDKSPGESLKLHFQTQNLEVYQSWCSKIKAILDMQKDFMSALQKPIDYVNKELTKDTFSYEYGSGPRNVALRKTQSHPTPKLSTPVKKEREENTRSTPKELPIPKTPHASSPTEATSPVVHKLKSEGMKTLPSALPSPPSKPKRTLFEGFKNTLRPNKSKSTGSCEDKERKLSSGSLSSPRKVMEGVAPLPDVSPGDMSPILVTGKEEGEDSALIHSMPDLVQDSQNAESYSSLPSAQSPALPSCEVLGAIGGSATLGADIKWKTSHSAPSSDGSPIESPGAVVKVLYDYQAVKEDEISVSKAETVTILSSNQDMLLVFRDANDLSPAAEGWIPSYVISSQAAPREVGDNGFRKSWHQALKLRKPSMGSRKDMKTGSLDRGFRKDNKDRTPVKVLNPDFVYEVEPSFTLLPADTAVHYGGTATFTCCVCGRPRPNIMWIAPNQTTLSDGAGVTVGHLADGTATLQLANVTSDNQGEYTVIANNEVGSVTATAMLMVIDKSTVAGKPVIKDQAGTTLTLEWEAPSQPTSPLQGYTIETRVQGSENWQVCASNIITTSYLISDLQPGITYEFQVICVLSDSLSAASEVSLPVSIPNLTEGAESSESGGVRWKTNFDQEYSEVSEISRGRFSIVKKCTEAETNRAVAAKFVTKKLLGREDVENEYTTLQSLQHENIVRALELFNSTSSHIIVLELLPSGRLLDYICSKSHFDEAQAAGYIQQVLNATQYLHNCRIAHLDLKPENLMVDLSSMSPLVKLTDFGDARRIYNSYYVHPLIGSPEFASPELVSGNPVGLLSDIWSVGVVTYVMLSGVSPFLDESPEETCSNIVRQDFCFPEEYFEAISQQAKDFISSLLIEDLQLRPTSQMCIDHTWIQQSTAVQEPSKVKPIPTDKLTDFIERRKHQNDTRQHKPWKNF